MVLNHYWKNPKHFFLPAFFMIVVISVNGQQVIPAFHKNVNLPSENLRFDFLLNLATKQTGIKFSLNTQKFRPSKIIHVRKGIQSVDEILSEIKKSTGISYTFLGDHIIFIDKPPLNIVVTNTVLTAKKRTDNDLPSSHVPHTSIPHLVSIAHTEKYLPGEGIDSIKTYQANGAKTNLPPPTSRRKRSNRQTTPFLPGFFAETGLTSDETFYINPSIQAGWPFLYGIAQWSTNFNVSGLRYGVGGSLRLTDKWRLGLVATTGAYSKDYPIGLTSFPIPITVKTSLQKTGILAEMKISHNIQMQFGPILNILSTKYYNSLGILTPLFINESDVNSHYQYIKPIYTIRDTYSSLSAQNTRIWIGSQVNFFYNINFLRSR